MVVSEAILNGTGDQVDRRPEADRGTGREKKVDKFNCRLKNSGSDGAGLAR